MGIQTEGAGHVLAGSANRFTATAGSVDITPDASLGPVAIAGHPGRRKPAQGVADPLEANAIVLRSDGSIAVFVSFDLLYVGPELRNAICAQLADFVQPEWIFTGASHTHFAPATDRQLPRLGVVSDAYVEFVAKRTIGLLQELLRGPPNPLTARYSLGQADHSVNRRRITFALPRGYRCAMRPNFEGPRDETIRVLSFADQAGKLAAVCWSYACHPVCSPQFDLISADFPGVVREAIRRRYGPIPVLYWQGFSGDVRPQAIKAHSGGLLGAWRAPSFGPFSQAQWNMWSGGIADCVLKALEVPGRAVTGPLSAARWAVPMAEFGPSAGNRAITVHEITVGSSLSLFGVSAEPFCDYGKLVSRSRSVDDVIPIGCIDAVPGYLPTDSAVPQGGYEVKEFMRLFGLSGHFWPNVSERFEKKIITRLAQFS